ncbi:MAG: FHA domain-containing protein [Planctomycetota bacterium]|nr:MAG: FHA domain-containing protein [Planctomycetota bacterium]
MVLRPGKPFSIGRSKERDLTIPSQRVSRQHAEIVWKQGRAVLRDLGSQNGTLVNGKRIKGEHSLRDGDELEFGPFLCTFSTRPPTSARLPEAEASNALTQPMQGDAMAGRLDQINLPELLQTLEFNGKTGTLEVFGPAGEGMIVVQEGRPTYAEAGAVRGEEAVYALLGLTRGQFSFSPEVCETSRNVAKTMSGLLMEAARRADEG